MSASTNATMSVFRNGEGSLPPNAPLRGTSILDQEEQQTDWPSTLSQKTSVREASPSLELTTNPTENPTLESPLPRAAELLRQSNHRKRTRTDEQQGGQQKPQNGSASSSVPFQTQLVKFKVSVPSKAAPRQRLPRGSACIRCQFLKKSCDGKIPCKLCRNLSREERPIWKQPCLQAKFPDPTYYNIASSRILRLNALRVVLTNMNREKQKLPPIADDFESKLARIMDIIYDPELGTSMMEPDIGLWIDQCNTVFADPIDHLGVVLRRDSLALMCAGLDMFTCLDDAWAYVDKDSISQELFPARDRFFAAYLVHIAKRESVLGIIQRRIASFRKHQLSICAGFNLLDSIISFAISVKFVCGVSTIDQMSHDQAHKDAGKQTFRMCGAYASILGERLAEPLQEIKSNPKAKALLSSVASSSKLLGKFNKGTSEPALGLAEIMGLEEYAEKGSPDDEESSANEDISNEVTLCREGKGVVGGQDAEEGNDAEEQIVGETRERIVDNETWFLEIFSSIPDYIEPPWSPSRM